MEKRIPKFRYWEKHAKLMYYSEEYTDLEEFWSYAKHKWAIPMQSTLLHDKTGKEIYEGDIVSSRRHKGLAVVGWLYARLNAFCEIDEGWVADILGERAGASEEDEVDCNELTIVGNIYQNPKLLQ